MDKVLEDILIYLKDNHALTGWTISHDVPQDKIYLNLEFSGDSVGLTGAPCRITMENTHKSQGRLLTSMMETQSQTADQQKDIKRGRNINIKAISYFYKEIPATKAKLNSQIMPKECGKVTIKPEEYLSTHRIDVRKNVQLEKVRARENMDNQGSECKCYKCMCDNMLKNRCI